MYHWEIFSLIVSFSLNNILYNIPQKQLVDRGVIEANSMHFKGKEEKA